MSENWLPTPGVCQDTFMNIIMIRHPIDRLLSHYNHILRLCKKEKSNTCHDMLQKNDPQYFNHTIMIQSFDIISDNYIVRSLNNLEGYIKHLWVG